MILVCFEKFSLDVLSSDVDLDLLFDFLDSSNDLNFVRSLVKHSSECDFNFVLLNTISNLITSSSEENQQTVQIIFVGETVLVGDSLITSSKRLC